MSALARIMLARGLDVSGSSDQRTALTDRLASEGARVIVGHAADNLGDARCVVVSSAIAIDNPELSAARARGLPVLHRGALLAELMASARGIAVAGTHGKTTTTAMIAAVLEAAGVDPTVVVGGELVATGSNARCGKGPWLVAESDESDGSFLDLKPEIAVVTNVENDHVASDEEFRRLIASFESFLAALPAGGLAVVGIDDGRAAGLAARARTARTVTFGLEAADVVARDVRYASFGSRFEVQCGGSRAGSVALKVPGPINVQNALAAIAVARELHVPFEAIQRGLRLFRGVRRRFEIVASTPRMTVVDDYAHHPTAVYATIGAARANWQGPLVVAFQPHRYTRTRYLAREFALALRRADRVVLTGIYPASETPLSGVDATTIGTPLRALGGHVEYVESVEDLPEHLLRSAPHGALVLALGAGTITLAAHRLGALLADDPSIAVRAAR